MASDLLKLANILDNYGFYSEADNIDHLIHLAAKTRVKPNYKNIAIILSPIIATMVWNKLHPPHTQPVVHPSAPPIVKPPLSKGHFEDFLDFVDTHEGGISRRKKSHDPGGLTNQGITQRVYNDYLKKHHKPHKSVTHMSDEERNEIIRARYWEVVKGNMLPKSIALVLADWKFNGGPAVTALQKAIGSNPTGIMDDNTLQNVWKFLNNDPNRELQLSHYLIQQRQKYLESLKTRKRHKKVPLINYNPGWYARLNDLYNEIKSAPS